MSTKRQSLPSAIRIKVLAVRSATPPAIAPTLAPTIALNITPTATPNIALAITSSVAPTLVPNQGSTLRRRRLVQALLALASSTGSAVRSIASIASIGSIGPAELLGLGSLGLPPSAFSQSPNTDDASHWPSKPLRILVGFPGGSTPDSAARTLADGLSKLLGQAVIVDNKPGASGNIAADLVAKANDGHTVGVVINGNLTSAKLLNPKLPFDPARDFQYLSLLTTAPLLLVAPPQSPSGKAFFSAAKAGGSQWNYGSVGTGSVAHLGMEWLKTLVPGMSAVHVPFPGNPQVVTAMLGGQIQMALIPPGVAMPQVRSGKLKAIGLTSGRSTLVPDVPPLADAGVQGFNLEVWTALVGPANMPAAVVKKLSTAVQQVLRDPEVRQRLFNQGWQAVGSAPEGLTARVRGEASQLGAIIKLGHIQAD